VCGLGWVGLGLGLGLGLWGSKRGLVYEEVGGILGVLFILDPQPKAHAEVSHTRTNTHTHTHTHLLEALLGLPLLPRPSARAHAACNLRCVRLRYGV